ncbi:DUF5957 family protein [Aliibacillus thermotolerans]|uniref:DUF5957 family protein n=1 Tax=Aliibacillus thermotolerans TaxID=1834418 RepID=A0ABW0U3E4_9BACI|nr:DUF5957 family protein [Aliibacillus thermotolerans]MDA3129439.1 hypothetical protein [Aliibacillus thermotolerans]
MRTFLTILVGLLGGFVIGIALSSMIGIFGMLFLNEPIGIKFLPYFTALLCAIIVPMIEQKSRNRS